MNQKQFAKVVAATQQKCTDLLVVKGAEYGPEDRLHNFRTSSVLQSCTMKQALAGKMAKHTVSIYDMISSGEDYSLAQWDEKILDHLNYLLLLRAILQEETESEMEKG